MMQYVTGWMPSAISKNQLPISFADLDIPVPDNGLDGLDAVALNKYLGALFLLRETLRQSWGENSEDLAAFDIVLSSALMIALQRRGLSQLMGEAQILGWVDNGVDLFPFVQARLRAFFELLKLGGEEKLSNIPIVGVVGKIASGKGSVAQVLSEKYDVMSFPFSDRLRAISLAMGFSPPYTRGELRRVNDVYKPTFGKHIFVEWTLIMAARMAESMHIPQLIVVDGFRSVEEAQFFLDQPNTHLIAVVADVDEKIDRQIRFQRQHARRRGEEDSLTMERFTSDDAIESTWIQPVIELAEERGKVVVNSGTLDDLAQKTFAVLGDILPPPTSD